MYNPGATYRIQFHKEFTLEQLKRIIPYLAKLGIQTLYASPIFAATPGSTHGYDGIEPHKVNPEIGTRHQLRKCSKELSNHRIGWLQDIVPNHMAFDTQNEWLMDVLEKGAASQYAAFFDIQKSTKGAMQVMVPFLGDTLQNVIDNGELKIAYADNRLALKYFDTIYPISKESYPVILQTNNNDLPAEIIEAKVTAANSDKQLLQQIAEAQHYRLCMWQETDKAINYRRFFTINGLICLNIQDEHVFNYYHKVIKELADEGIFKGLRIDHIDGLYDPTQYLERLRSLAGEDAYITIEKILDAEETIPEQWPIQGNTGYDFLAMVNKLFANGKSERQFTHFYEQLTKDTTPVQQQLYTKKAAILYDHMAGELDNLYKLLTESGLVEKSLNDEGSHQLKEAIAKLLIYCPVYRYYGNELPLDSSETAQLTAVFNNIKKDHPSLVNAIDVLEHIIIHKPVQGNEAYNKKAIHFYKRCMQFTGPLMAKGNEDTLMYTYNRFIAHNEVGDTALTFHLPVESFHRKMIERQAKWPLSLNTTATHDTKRGEDVRARLNTLTDIPAAWIKAVKQWQKENSTIVKNSMPDINDQYFIYQSLTGSYPMPGIAEEDYKERLQAYMQKALREAKIHSTWAAPNERYEAATNEFIAALFDKNTPFWNSFKTFHERITDYGIINSLSQLLLKFTCPGVPDIYQGTELWDLSFVDPDNRRPVDYDKRAQILASLNDTKENLIDLLWNTRFDGRIKLWLTHLLLQERKQRKELFAQGLYIPLKTGGKYKDHIMAFARRYQHEWSIVAVPLHIAVLCEEQKKQPSSVEWKNTHIILPKEMPEIFEHILQTEDIKHNYQLQIKDIFKKMPLAILRSKKMTTKRSAGVLLSIASLPSDYGIGDLGKGAREFADFLSKSNQSYWQLLPLNPIDAGARYSPYSSVSAMAGNILLLSPDLLQQDGLLSDEDVKEHRTEASDKVDYQEAERIKTLLFDKAYENYKSSSFPSLQSAYTAFCRHEAYWLDDFATYMILQTKFDKPWFEWPDEYKERSPTALQQTITEHANDINKIKWLQFLFFRQWHQLKGYCRTRGIHLFGDLPFYVSYGSVDVWAHPEIFCLDDTKKINGIAGVPPDYFSEDGQLWGMPTYNWHELKNNHYKWWIQRIKKNLQLFDLLRLDHFRAFAEYWQVPAGETTARNGTWKAGPGKDFFDVVKKEIGGLPFVAEDLGDKMEKVYMLRDEIGLPGMKVLQFAFGENMPYSVDIPHNYTPNCIVYTGTHDNNTTIGWYHQETNKADHKRLEQYLGSKVRIRNVHHALGRMAYSSIAATAILPMQDILGLDETHRTNTPGTDNANWLWRLKSDQLTIDIEDMLRNWTKFYNRI